MNIIYPYLGYSSYSVVEAEYLVNTDRSASHASYLCCYHETWIFMRSLLWLSAHRTHPLSQFLFYYKWFEILSSCVYCTMSRMALPLSLLLLFLFLAVYVVCCTIIMSKVLRIYQWMRCGSNESHTLSLSNPTMYVHAGWENEYFWFMRSPPIERGEAL